MVLCQIHADFDIQMATEERVMLNRIILCLFQKRGFWWLRRILRRIFFWVDKRIFGIRYSVKEEKLNYQSINHIFQITYKPLLFAIGFGAFLQYIDSYENPLYQRLAIHIPDSNSYVTFLATVSSIGGIFIGLYYAGISAVSSAIYARVPNNIRDLLAQERIGNVYLRFLSFLTTLGLILIAFTLLKFPPISLGIPIVALLAGIGIIAFVKLGQRAFYLFDPTKLSHYIFERMLHWLGMVKAGGFRWQDRSFQQHAHKQASDMLDTLETLADITAKETHLSGRPFIILSNNLLLFLSRYEHEKKYIPTESAWYEQRYQHRDWYRTEGSHVAMAHHTGTILQPVVINNKEWVEDRIIPILKKCIIVNLEKKNYPDILSLFNYLDAYFKGLALEGRAGRAFALLDEITASILNELTPQTTSSVVKEEVLEKLAIAERLASMPISIALGYRERLEMLTRQGIVNQISSIRWDNDKSIYRQNYQAYCLARLEWLMPRLNFERAVESCNVTPLWYLTELVCQVEAEQFEGNISTLVDKAAVFYRDFINKASSGKRPWIAAAVMSREWEYWHKVENQTNMWQEKWAVLCDDRRVEGLPWVEIDLDKLKASSITRKRELLKSMSQQNLLLSLLPRPEGYPDFAGQFLHTSGEVAFDALLTNDHGQLKNVFEPYLFGCLLRFDSLRPKVGLTDWRAQQEFKIAAAALLDLMDLSGYAKLLADYHENTLLWDEVTAAWNKYLTMEQEKSPVQLLAGILALIESSYEIPHRGVLRTAWNQKINRKLQDVPRREVFNRGSFGSDVVIEHESALIRIFARDRLGSFHDGIDIFITFYLCKLDSAKDVKMSWKRRDLKDSIIREEARRAKTQKPDKDV